MECTQCASPIDESAAFCPQCGAPASAAARPPESAAVDEATVRPLLAAAHLHKRRQQYQQAIAKCLQVLEQQPGNATACSLLGDIERARGGLREAAEWYKQAVAADVANVADRRKLDEVLDRLYVSPEPAAVDLDSAAAAEVASGGRRRRPWVPLLIGFAALVIVVVAVVSGYMMATSRGVSVTMPTISVPSAPPAGPRAAAPTPAPRPSAASATPRAPASSEFMDERERRAAEAAGAAIQGQQPAASVAGVFVRPDDNEVELTLSLTGAPPTEAHRAVLQAAVAAVQAIHRSDAALKSFSIRIRAPMSATSGATHSAVVFMGDLAAAAVADRDINTLSADDAEALFSQTWWRPGFAGSAARGSAGATEARP